VTNRISVFGLGYVGSVSAACFARDGFDVMGVDVNPAKVDLINRGIPTVVEEGIADVTRAAHESGRLSATTDAREAVEASDVSLICVGTPSLPNGYLDTSFLERVSRDIGAALRSKQGPHTVVIRSTMLPGTAEDCLVPAIREASGRGDSNDLVVCVNPEFLREGSSIRDFYEPAFTLIGAATPAEAERLTPLYQRVNAPIRITTIRVAEFVKYVSNMFHALKVTFANEVGNVCKAMGIDSHEVMDIVCADRKLNISPAYLRPGFAFGGSCLPKDVRALAYQAQRLDVPTPVLAALIPSNQRQIDHAFDMIMRHRPRRIGVLGLSFKTGTDDLRESALVALIERLIGKGKVVSVFDQLVSESTIVGANREYVEGEIPHIWSLLRPSAAEVVKDADVIVVGSTAAACTSALQRVAPGQVVIDLVRVAPGLVNPEGSYEGICW
jgi:GDP-mannose 6-dehydrogenase